MKRGALCMIDALGFKGIWKRAEPDVVIRKLRSLSAAIETHLNKVFGDRSVRASLARSRANGLELVQALALSDTFVFAIAFKSAERLRDLLRDPETKAEPEFDSARLDAAAIELAANAAGAAILAAVETEPVLAFRGAISFGDFELDSEGRFLVGPAVDDAAECHELADGAFVWTTPTASSIVNVDISTLHGLARNVFPPHVLLPFAVPLKGGRQIIAYVVNPFIHCDTEEQCQRVDERMTGSFSQNSLDVTIKRQHTEVLLKSAKTSWRPRGPIASTKHPHPTDATKSRG